MSRGFFRVLMLEDHVWKNGNPGGRSGRASQRLGVGELELFALEKMADLELEEILLV